MRKDYEFYFKEGNCEIVLRKRNDKIGFKSQTRSSIKKGFK